MDYPYSATINVPNVFETQSINITLHSGLTTFVGPNGSGKTQTLKAFRDYLKGKIGHDKVRYLTSNRIGTMEVYRSKTDSYSRTIEQFNIGNQDQKRMRHQIETANGDFFTMDERKDVYIKVAERLSVLFDRQIYLRWDAGNLKVFVEKTASQKEYSVAAEASGLVNLISILAALFDESTKVLLIDEPEVSLHPQLQSYLLREIETAVEKYRKTVIISTHSAEMICLSNPTDLCNFVFFQEDGNLPIQVPPTAPELQGERLKEFLLRMGVIYKEAFFAKKVFLIEGSSDLIICHYLSNRFRFNLDVAGAQIIPVEGKGQFAVVAKLFRMIGKEIVVLTDLDGFTDDNSVVNLFFEIPKSVEIANNRGFGDFQEFVRNVKSALDRMIQTHKEIMSPIYQNHPYWINRDPEADENKIVRRAMVAMLFTENDNSIATWAACDEWRKMKVRLTTLFDSLEGLGCFVLRKGAVESYYLHSPNTTFNGKPSAAALETTELASDSDAQVQEKYSDLLRALQFTALDKTVDESFAVQKELLSELALILGILNEQTTEAQIISAIKQAKGINSSLFDYHIIKDNKDNARLGLEVSIKSNIISVTGFPFEIFKGDNVNQVVAAKVKSL